MPTYSLINNGDTGLSVRNNLNEIIGDINDGTIGGGGGESGTTAYITTTNGATASIAIVALGTYSTFNITAKVSGWDSSNSLAYGSELFGVFKKVGETTTQVSTTDTYEKSNFATASSHIIVDTDPKIVVIGEVGKNINWVVNYSVVKI
jgi:hypothetical protein